ncbi:DUF3310 domain-containing protein [Paenibacillus thiaminolyticus]|uniref:DUF3310 domain-containing protein n=1 Tax=Paenibacillus thiaminolyticus TaxID=49283 RepID=UPI002542791B|nr:DUF3310 domain-containing protein [Paenibacillus thiaminolyticus]WII39684.1 DUF3310 domain-containing protein [Paenibacillus thiaminolyticus]
MGTPIPNRENEAKSAGHGPVVPYTLPPEELERYRAMPAPDGKVKMPVGTRIAKANEERKHKAAQETKEAKVSKEEYLKLRAQGKTHDEIERTLGLSKGTLSAYWLRKWELRGVTAEKARQLLEKAEDRTPTLPVAELQTDPLDTLIEADSDLQSWKQLCDSQAQCILEQSNRIMDYESELARWAQVDADNRQRINELEEDVHNWRKQAEELKQRLEKNAAPMAQHPEHDPVERPSHYTVGGIETIDIIRAKLTPEEFRGYCKGNVLKYVCRERWKGGDEDLQKTRKYIEFALEDEDDED